jgi:hypothetical protein
MGCARQPPPGAAVKCLRCRGVFRVPTKQTILARVEPPKPALPVKKTRLAAPKQVKATQLAPQAPLPKTKPRPTPIVPIPARRPLPWRIIAAAVAVLLVVLGTGLWFFLARDRAEWTTFAPPGERCRVLMPGLPDRKPARTNASGLAGGRKFSVVRAADDVGYCLCTLDAAAGGLPRNAIVEVYQAERDHMLKASKAQLTSESDLTLGGRFGKEFQARLADGKNLVVRFYFGSDRVYVLLAGGPKVRSDSGDAARFFGSFHIEP